MEAIRKEKSQLVIILAAVFLLGCLAGALGMNFYRGRVAPGPQIRRVLNSLDLSDQQRAAVDQVLADTRRQLMDLRQKDEPQVSAIRSQARDRLKAILTPAQWQKFTAVMGKKFGREGGRGPEREHGFPSPQGRPSTDE